ncbi:hypothetical protein BG000_003458, partial [Podila horticola]
NAETVIIAPNKAKKYRFNIYEGPSLNESADNFEKNIFSVHRTLVESEAQFHQVLFTLAPGRLTRAIRTTIRVCSDIFSDLSSLFSFVHTKIDYPKLHIGNKQFQDSMKERTELLQRYTQSSAAPYMIDCNLQSNWPVQRAKTYNVVHEILKSATSQTPVALKSPLMKKTPRMVLIDSMLKWQAIDAFHDAQREIDCNNDDLLELYGKIHQLDIDYKTKDQEVNSAKNKEDVATRDDMEIVFEDTFHAPSDVYPEIYSKTMTFKKQPRMIEKVHMVAENVEIELTLGGEGAGNFAGETKELNEIRAQRLELGKQLVVVDERNRSKWHIQKGYHLLRKWIARETLPKTVMEELTKYEVYEAEDTPFVKIKEIYLKSGSVYDTDPCEPPEAPADAPKVVEIDEDEGILWRCSICGEDSCNKAECKAIVNLPFDIDNDEGILWSCVVCFEKECNKAECKAILVDDLDSDSDELPKTVLMLGKTQAGKSTFIECVKNYSSQRYDIDESLLGNGFRSKTREPMQFTVTSNLPAYEVLDSNGTMIDIDALGDIHQNPEDYSDALNDRNTKLTPVPHKPGTSLPFVEITFLDTPGIEDTNGRDVEHAPKIIEAMARMQVFNCIIVVINCEETPSVSHQLAFNYYSKVIYTFQGHHSNIVFVYTHVDYGKCHRSNADHLSMMELRHKAFSQLFRCQGSYNREDVANATIEPYPKYHIDFAKRQRPVTRCMRLMTLRDILTNVVNSSPVVLDTSTNNMQRIQAITHPDELNQAERKIILKTTRAILGQGKDPQGCSNAPATASEGFSTHKESTHNAGDDDRVTDQSQLDHDDEENCAEYFFGLAPSDCLDSDEDEGDDCSGF